MARRVPRGTAKRSFLHTPAVSDARGEPIRRFSDTDLPRRRVVVTTTPPAFIAHISCGHCAKTLSCPPTRCRLAPARRSTGPLLSATTIVAVACAAAEPLQEAV